MTTEEKTSPSAELKERMSALAVMLEEWARRAGPERDAYEAVAEAARRAAGFSQPNVDEEASC